MSEYFRVLKRIEKDQSAGPKRRNGRAAHAVEQLQLLDTGEALPTAPAEPAVVAEPSAAAVAAFAILYDNLRGLAKGGMMRSIVFAGASARESVRTVTTGLAAHAERLGLSVAIGELGTWHARPILRLCPEHAATLGADNDPLPFDLHGQTEFPEVTEWLERVARDAALILIEGPPLAESIDSGLLARACDGLVIVVETLTTARQALQIAADRARVSGCRTLGVVTYGTNDRMPAWIRHWVQSDQRLLMGGK